MLAHSIPTFPIWNHVLALTYGVNYCRANPCHGAPINFERITIHGLWPNSRPSKNPLRPQDTLLQYCDLSSQLRARDLSTPITIELKTNWPSITNYQIQGQPLGVWNYEWRKHGICTWFNKEPYFRRALDIYYVVNPDLILTSFPPNNTVKYTVTDIQNYHRQRNFPIPYLYCYGDLLLEIDYCLNDAADTIVNCDIYYSLGSNCGSNGFYIYTM
ncbi:hypothetical protein BVRB_5g113230 [Beta vulgaris subsp. vulgaris]|nr:hypothetical protein BVRB_5g113230 [Beta vulgaris subsp. vulgaris]